MFYYVVHCCGELRNKFHTHNVDNLSQFKINYDLQLTRTNVAEAVFPLTVIHTYRINVYLLLKSCQVVGF